VRKSLRGWNPVRRLRIRRGAEIRELHNRKWIGHCVTSISRPARRYSNAVLASQVYTWSIDFPDARMQPGISEGCLDFGVALQRSEWRPLLSMAALRQQLELFPLLSTSVVGSHWRLGFVEWTLR